MATEEVLLVLVLSVHVAVQVEACSEAFLTAVIGTPEQPSFPRVDPQLVQVQKPSLPELLATVVTLQPDWRETVRQEHSRHTAAGLERETVREELSQYGDIFI